MAIPLPGEIIAGPVMAVDTLISCVYSVPVKINVSLLGPRTLHAIIPVD